MTDPEIVDSVLIGSVLAEWDSGTCSNISVRAIIWMVDALRKGYGDATTVDGVRQALDELSDRARLISENLWLEKFKQGREKK